jgi:uncharacterized iron-regulated membrane protein
VAATRYFGVMTLLILILGMAAAMATVVACVAWRDRRTRGSFVDPSISRGALVQADRQAVQGRLAEAGMPVTEFISHRPGSH